jgi:hypothetical protein
MKRARDKCQPPIADAQTDANPLVRNSVKPTHATWRSKIKPIESGRTRYPACGLAMSRHATLISGVLMRAIFIMVFLDEANLCF